MKRWQKKKRAFVTSATMFPSGAELLLALPGVKRTVEGRAGRAAFADRSCACLFMQRNSWGFGESFKDEDGCTSCMAFSSGWAFCIWPLTKVPDQSPSMLPGSGPSHPSLAPRGCSLNKSCHGSPSLCFIILKVRHNKWQKRQFCPWP